MKIQYKFMNDEWNAPKDLVSRLGQSKRPKADDSQTFICSSCSSKNVQAVGNKIVCRNCTNPPHNKANRSI